MKTRASALILAAALLASCALRRSLGSGHRDVEPPLSQPSAAPSTPLAAAGAAAMPPREPDDISLDQTRGDNPAGLTPAEVDRLRAGGSPGDMRWSYPYDGTVFPGGSIAPLVMWSGTGPADAVYLHIRSRHFEYEGVLRPSVEGGLFIPEQTLVARSLNDASFELNRQPQRQVVIPQFAWDAAVARTLGARDPFVVELTVRAGDQIYGPVRSQFVIARGSVQGSIYYNTCFAGTLGTGLDPGVGSQGIGARVMRIPPHGNAEVVSDPVQCVGCHTVSANGARLVAQRSFAVADVPQRVLDPSAPAERFTHALSLPLRRDGAPDLLAGTPIGMMGSYGALYPDGSKYLAASGRIDAGVLSRVSRLERPAEARLVDAASGALVPDTGISPDATMPMFSPDGTRLVFNDASRDGYRLAVMEYDVNAHKASGYRSLVDNDTTRPLRPGWPSFLPDGRAVVFVQTDSADFSSKLSAVAGAPAANSELYIADVATGKTTLLARAMGARNNFPTVSPAASGGYYWLFFDSVRDFGSMGPMRALWGAAIDIHPDGSYTSDPSHPPFFVPGQEFLDTGHFRAFAALDRCLPDGQACSLGIDCCTGVCTAANVCGSSPPDTCAARQQRCAVTADCCDSADYCINGFCSLVELL